MRRMYKSCINMMIYEHGQDEGGDEDLDKDGRSKTWAKVEYMEWSSTTTPCSTKRHRITESSDCQMRILTRCPSTIREVSPSSYPPVCPAIGCLFDALLRCKRDSEIAYIC